MSIVKRNRMITYVWLDVLCHIDKRHTLGAAILNLEGRTDAGRIKVGNGLHWDDRGKAVGDCSECAVTGKGKDQQVSRARIETRLNELLAAGRHAGDLQV
jgi:hypothetical protein